MYRPKIQSFRQLALMFGWLLPGLTAAGVALYLTVRRTLHTRYTRRIYRADQVPARQVAMILGAGVYPDERLSALLQDRLDTGIALFDNGKVDRLLITADDRPEHQRQTTAMAKYAMREHVPDKALILDPAGSRTYASCYRARYVYGLDSLIVVTQRFHLDRTLYLCERLGIDAVGVAADRRQYKFMRFWQVREVFAWLAAWRDTVMRPGR